MLSIHIKKVDIPTGAMSTFLFDLQKKTEEVLGVECKFRCVLELLFDFDEIYVHRGIEYTTCDGGGGGDDDDDDVDDDDDDADSDVDVDVGDDEAYSTRGCWFTTYTAYGIL